MGNFNKFNRTGFILRIIGATFVALGLYLVLVFSENRFIDIDVLLLFGLPGVLLIALGILMIRKTDAALRVAELITLVGAPLLGVILVFVTRNEEGLGHPGMGLFFFLPFYVPIVIVLQYLISSELDKSRKKKKSWFYKLLLPAILVVVSYVVALEIFSSTSFF